MIGLGSAGPAFGQAPAPPDAPPPGANYKPMEAPLEVVLESDTVANGIALSRDGRIFLPFSRIDGSTGPQVVEWKDGKPVAFPDAAKTGQDWNGWEAGRRSGQGLRAG